MATTDKKLAAGKEKNNKMDPTDNFPIANSQKYTGQKNIPGVIQKIINEIPETTVFFELFAGSAAVSKYLSKIPGLTIILNDLNSDVVDFWDFTPTIFYHENALKLLENIILFNIPEDKDTFLFLDPPYLHETRKDNKLYEFEMMNFEHDILLSCVQQVPCKVMIIHPACKLYDEALKGWRTVEIKIRYNNKTSIEKLYMNYQKPEKLLCYNFVGSDCWDRQRIKRKGDRLLNKITKLPNDEKNYLLERLKKEFIF